MPNEVKVLGEKELRRTLKKAGDDLSDLKDVHQRVGNLVVEVARVLAPRRTGSLAASVRSARLASGIAIRAGNARVPYAGPIHWGWPKRHIRAQPFLSDAATSTEEAWVGMYMHELENIVDTIKGD